MKSILVKTALLLLAAAVPAAASGPAPIEGHWTSPKRTLVVRVAPCGDAWCGTVIRASDVAKARALEGGTQHLVGTQLLIGVRPDGDGAYRGHAFDPNRNLRVSATVRLDGSTTLIVKGCMVGGILCREQRWT